MRGQSCITQSLFAGYQLILPGEIAPSHRHTQSALRFIVEGSGAYTAVDGERTTMRPGDFIITPSWTWHDHGNPGIGAGHLAGRPRHAASCASSPRNSTNPSPRKCSRFRAARARPSRATATTSCRSAPSRRIGKTSPIFSYPYDRSRETLARLAREEDPDPCHGWKMEFINPLTGGPAMPTIGTFIQLLPKGFRSEPYRSTDGTVYSVAEGEGKVKIGGEEFAFGPKDTFRRAVLAPGQHSKPTASACCSPSPTGRRRRRWACGGSSADERARRGLLLARVQQPRAGPGPRADASARWVQELGARARDHDLPPRPALRRGARRDASTSSRRARATAAA